MYEYNILLDDISISYIDDLRSMKAGGDTPSWREQGPFVSAWPDARLTDGPLIILDLFAIQLKDRAVY